MRPLRSPGGEEAAAAREWFGASRQSVNCTLIGPPESVVVLPGFAQIKPGHDDRYRGTDGSSLPYRLHSHWNLTSALRGSGSGDGVSDGPRHLTNFSRE